MAWLPFSGENNYRCFKGVLDESSYDINVRAFSLGLVNDLFPSGEA
jgi:hypothetical protein